jgi:hypothetical protein
MSDSNDYIYSPFGDTADEQSSKLIDGAAEKVQWARDQAKVFLEHADALEERAEQYRHLAALMILEAQGYAGDISDLLAAEFPMTDPEAEDEGHGSED